MTPTITTLITRATSFSNTTATAVPSCIDVTPLKNGYVPSYACNAYYNFSPSLASAVFFSVVFGLVLVGHIIQAARYKKWRLGWVIIMGAAWEFVGSATLAAGSQQQQNQGLASSSFIFALLAPLWINAGVYMITARLIYFYIPSQKIWGVRATRISLMFILLDIASFLVQGIGGAMTTPGNDAATVQKGLHLYMGGIGLQQTSIIVFTAFAVQFCIVAKEQKESYRHVPWRPLMIGLFFSLAMITMRIIYRMVEFAKGLNPDTNPIPFHQAYSALLDSTPMFLALLALLIVHPGQVLQGENSEFPKRKNGWCCCGRKRKQQTGEAAGEDQGSEVETPSSEVKRELA